MHSGRDGSPVHHPLHGGQARNSGERQERLGGGGAASLRAVDAASDHIGKKGRSIPGYIRRCRQRRALGLLVRVPLPQASRRLLISAAT